MNCKQANEIKLTDFLAKALLLQPIQIKGSEASYLSPFRNEKNASFFVDTNKNIWYDAGEDVGGDIIDFAMRLYSTNIKGTLQHLSPYYKSDFKAVITPKYGCKSKSNKLVIKPENTQSLQHKALIQYLESRKVNIAIAKTYCKEAYFKVNNKKYFSIAFKNDKGGFELRNKFKKQASSPKSITTIKGKSTSCLCLFEGFLDFLSALTHYNLQQPNYDTIILNSTTSFNLIKKLLSNYKKINSFCDNDETGQKIINKLKYNHTNIINQSKLIYPHYNDFNDFICS